jgi:lysophospholipase L1-like esterase
MREEMIYNPNYYQLRGYMIQTMEKIIAGNQKSKSHGVLFFGDSIIEWYDIENYYPEIRIKYNSGICGATSESLRWICDEAVIKYKPQVIVLMVGTNDFGNTNMRSPREIAQNVQILLELIQGNLPNAHILLLETLPCDEIFQGSSVGKKMRSNKMIALLNEEYKNMEQIFPNLVLVSTFELFLDKQKKSIISKYTTDGLHLSEAGYARLTQIIKPILIKYITDFNLD